MFTRIRRSSTVRVTARIKGRPDSAWGATLSIADTLDAIIDRPYRPARPFHAAKKEIQDWAGRQFDPEIVKIYNEIPDKLWMDLRRQIDAQIHNFPSYASGAKGGL